MELFWVLTILFMFVTVVFMIIAYFLPEWVGITGKTARQAMAEQAGEEQPPASDKKP